MNTDFKSKMWGDLFAISQMMVQLATIETSENSNTPNEDGALEGIPNEGLIIPKSGQDSPQPVQKDGPKGKANARTVPPVISLKTLGGELFVFDHGKMIQKGLFEYRHIAPDLMTSVLSIGPETASLAPDENDYPGTELTIEPKKTTPTSESVLLKGVTFGKTLALQYSDDPIKPYANLVTIPESELMSTLKKIEQKQEGPFKINPVIKIRSITPSTSTNNIALYFVTSRFYYYIYVNSETNPPKLELKRVDKTPEYDPHTDYIRHVQFKEKPIINHPRDEIDGTSLDSIPENNEEENSNQSDPDNDLSKMKDLALERSNSEGSGSASKPASLDLRILVNPSIVRDQMTDEDKVLDDSPPSANGEDKPMPEKQTSTSDSPTHDEDPSCQNGDSPASNGMSKTDLSSEVDATVE